MRPNRDLVRAMLLDTLSPVEVMNALARAVKAAPRSSSGRLSEALAEQMVTLVMEALPDSSATWFGAIEEVVLPFRVAARERDDAKVALEAMTNDRAAVCRERDAGLVREMRFRCWLDHAGRIIGGENNSKVIAEVDRLQFASPFESSAHAALLDAALAAVNAGTCRSEDQ